MKLFQLHTTEAKGRLWDTVVQGVLGTKPYAIHIELREHAPSGLDFPTYSLAFGLYDSPSQPLVGMSTTLGIGRELAEELLAIKRVPLADMDIAAECAKVWTRLNSWKLTPDQMLSASLSNGNMGTGRMNGNDDRPEDTVYRSPEGHELTRHMVRYFLDQWRGFEYGWLMAHRHAIDSAIPATVETEATPTNAALPETPQLASRWCDCYAYTAQLRCRHTVEGERRELGGYCGDVFIDSTTPTESRS